jgi:hypothetical protein
MRCKSKVKTCPNCFAVVPAGEPVCPNCGYRFKEERKTPEVIEGVMLQEISSLPYYDYKKCRTFEELDRFRKAKRYKFCWTIHRALEMHIPIPDKYSRLADRLRTG